MSITLQGYLNQRASIIRKKQSAYGTGDGETLFENAPCRFVEEGESKWDGKVGAEVTIGTAQAWFDGGMAGVRIGDKLLIEEAAQFTIVKISRTRDIDGNADHTKMVLA